MTANMILRDDIAVDKKLNADIFVVHKPHNAYRAGENVEKLEHSVAVREGKAGDTELSGKVLGLERFIARHQQKVEIGLLPVAQEQILAHGDSESLVDLGAGFHGFRAGMIYSFIVNSEAVEKLIYASFSFAATVKIVGTSAE